MLLGIIIWIFLLPYLRAEGFVEQVACSADHLTVVLNKSDPDVAKWMSDKTSQPVVYVYGHKLRHNCGSSMKKENGEVNYNLTVPYGDACDVILSDVEPNYRTAETTIALEDNSDLSYTKTLRINHVFCLYTRSVQTIRFNDVSSDQKVEDSIGGKPKPKVEMFFHNANGKPLRAAKLDDAVELFIALVPDEAYHGITPIECLFSDREDMQTPGAQRLTFVQGSCPVNEMAVIEPLANVNEQVYFSKFNAFRFGSQSTVFVHCNVQVCLRSEECQRSCYKRVTNSNLTAERLRFRHRRSAVAVEVAKNQFGELVNITEAFTILSDSESQEVSQPIASSVEQCQTTVSGYSSLLPILCLILLASTICALILASYLGYRMKSGRKDCFEVTPAPNSAVTPTPIHNSNNSAFAPYRYSVSFANRNFSNYR